MAKRKTQAGAPAVQSSKKLSVAEQLEAIKLQKEVLELKLMQRDVEQMEAATEASRMTSVQQEAMMAQAKATIAAKIKDCAHKKGGSNMDGFAHGNSENYSVVKNTYPMPYLPDFPHCTGRVVQCQRCPLEINEGDPLFAEAWLWPTNNKPAGNPLYTVTYEQPKRAAA